MLYEFYFRGFDVIRRAEHILNIYTFGDSLRKCSFIKIVIQAKKPETQMDMIGREQESKRAAQKHIECAREMNAEKRF